MNLPAGDLPSCYNAIPQEYALGFINNVKSIDRAKRDITINSNHKGNGKGTATFYPGKSAGDLTGERSPLKYFDLYDGASYMGDLYDFRVYAYGNARARDVNNSLVEHWHSGGNYVASEWHFYPRNTLKKLDQLYYSPEEDIIESGIGDPKDSCTTVKEKDPKTGKQVPVGETCTYDKNAARDENGNIIYTGVFRESEYGPVAVIDGITMTAAGMETYLKQREDSVRLLGAKSEDLGTFKGTVAFRDIDTWGLERYAAASGVQSVFTIRESIEYASFAKHNGKNNSIIYSNTYFKNSNFCQDPTEDKTCYYAWGGTGESDPGKKESWMWFNFSSQSTAPFALIYAGSGHGSFIESSQFYITHIIKDDLADIPEEIIASAQNFQQDFETLYGHSLADDKNFPSGEEPDRTLRFFQIYQYADYSPYTMNDLLRDLNVPELKWYTCEDMTDDCLVPYDPEHDNGFETTADGNTYVNGYDFIDSSKTYYASMGEPLEVNFPNTCYSDNISTVEVQNAE